MKRGPVQGIQAAMEISISSRNGNILRNWWTGSFFQTGLSDDILFSYRLSFCSLGQDEGTTNQKLYTIIQFRNPKNRKPTA